MTCPLCQHSQPVPYDQDKSRSYLKCPQCHLVYVPRDQLISDALEKDRYESHENSEDNDGYKLYLAKIAESIRSHLKDSDTGLDFGSGKTTLLANLLSPHAVVSYDLFFHPDETLLDTGYDFIILSEVIEHLREPLIVMEKLVGLLNPQGKIFIKTKFYPCHQQDFSHWFYKRDITHIQFFTEQAFTYLSSHLLLKTAEKIGEDLYLFKK